MKQISFPANEFTVNCVRVFLLPDGVVQISKYPTIIKEGMFTINGPLDNFMVESVVGDRTNRMLSNAEDFNKLLRAIMFSLPITNDKIVPYHLLTPSDGNHTIPKEYLYNYIGVYITEEQYQTHIMKAQMGIKLKHRDILDSCGVLPSYQKGLDFLNNEIKNFQ